MPITSKVRYNLKLNDFKQGFIPLNITKLSFHHYTVFFKKVDIEARKVDIQMYKVDIHDII